MCVCLCDLQAGKTQSPQFPMGNFSSAPSSAAPSSFGQMGGAPANVPGNTPNYSQMNARNHQSTNGYGKSSKTRKSRSLFLHVSYTLPHSLSLSLSHSRSLTPGDASQPGPQFSSRPAEAAAWQQWQNQAHTQSTTDAHPHIQNSQPEMFTVSTTCVLQACALWQLNLK